MTNTIKTQITLISPTDKIVVPLQIKFNDCDTEMKLAYNGIQYTGKGSDYLWEDAFANLQKELPKEVKLACCMTCRHGNMCPYGNKPNELFCTKDISVNSKIDMCDLFDKTDAYNERKVFSCGFCDEFAYQSETFYTYKDYLYQLHKE